MFEEFEEQNAVSKLSEKINDLLVRFEETSRQNEAYRQEIVTLKAQNEAKNVQISKLEKELNEKNIEADDILSKIEGVLRK